MYRHSARWRSVAPILMGLSLSACVTRWAQQAEPHWVRRGEGLFWDTTAVYGVGMSTPADVRPVKVLKQAADLRVRAQIRAAIDTYVDQLFQEAGFEDQAAASAEEMRSVSAAVLSEGSVVQRWIDPFSGTVYALFRVDRGRIPRAIMTAERIGEIDRQHLAAQADAVFERLRQQGEPWR